MTTHHIIYDGNCNLCVTLVQLLEQLDRGQQFDYITMQSTAVLAAFGITTQDCEQGMILIQSDRPAQKWQGTAAAEEIGRLLPLGGIFVAAYRALPGFKPLGDRMYEQVRDHRYDWFGRRDRTHISKYSACPTGTCLK